MFSPLLRPFLGPRLPWRELYPDVSSSEQLAGPPQSWSDMQREAHNAEEEHSPGQVSCAYSINLFVFKYTEEA